MREPVSNLRLLINLLLIIEVFLGISLIVLTLIYQHILATFMTAAESKILSAKFFNTYVIGFQLILSYLYSISMWKRIWPRRYSQNIQLLLSIWLFFCFLIVICGCATIYSLRSSADELAENTEMMLFNGIDIYYMNPEWKLLWDQLQYNRECCGVHSYQDWMHASWMPQDISAYLIPPMPIRNGGNGDYSDLSVNENPKTSSTLNSMKINLQTFSYRGDSFNLGETQMKEKNNIEGERTLAPYACCKHDSASCYGNYIPTLEGSSVSGIPNLNLSEIHTNGCLPIFKENIWYFMNILFILMLVAILIDIVICCLIKYLMITNCRKGYRELNTDMSVIDDEGNALVVIKCPPKVRCITLEEQSPYDSDIPNLLSDADPCQCCIEDPTEYNFPHKNDNYILH